MMNDYLFKVCEWCCTTWNVSVKNTDTHYFCPICRKILKGGVKNDNC